MRYIVQQEDIDILYQSVKTLHCRLELLNHNMKVIDSIEGNLISDNFSCDASSDIRRTYSLDLHVSNSTFLVGSDKKIWIDKYIRPYVGVIHQRTQDIKYYLNGTFAFNDTAYSYDEASRTLSLSCSDLMCTLNGDRGGSVKGLSIKIPAGSYIREVLISLLEDAGVTKYQIEDIGHEIPYDLEYSAEITYYEILKEIVELYAGYEMFFDLDGTFVVQKIPTTENDIAILDSKTINPLVISESTDSTFNNIYNSTQIWGKVIETDYYTDSASSSDGINYIATLSDEPKEMDNFGKYGVKILTTNKDNPTLNFNNIGAIKLVNDDGNQLQAGRLLANTDYVFKYRKATNDLLLLGQYQAHGEYKQYDSDCPFSITNLGYEINQVLEFDELESDSLCEQRAKYETWLATRMQDKIALNMIAIPFLDVNWKISYTSENTGIQEDYIIKSISGSNSEFIMDVELIKFSELYPDIVPN